MDNIKNYLNNMTILFVDDEDGIRDPFGTLIGMWSKKAYTASNGKEGLEVYKKYKPDIIVTDIKMPIMTGLEMIGDIKEVDPEIPIIITTAFQEPEFLLDAIELKVDGYIVKPIAKKELKKRLNIIAKTLLFEKEIEKKNILNQLYLDMAGTLMVTLDKNGNITMLNKTGCELLGFNENEILGKNWFDIGVIPKESIKDVQSYFYKTIRGEIELSQDKYENSLISKDGTSSMFIWSNILLKEKDEITGIFSSALDITKIKKLENEKLKQQETILHQEKLVSMGEMIGNIAHQWRQPLSVISTAATGMKLQREYGVLNDELFSKSCETINNNAQFLSKTIDDFRNFIKGDRNKKLFNLKDEIDDFIHLIDGSAKTNYINIILDIEESIQINGYKNELSQCLINIYNNSKDALIQNDINNKLIFISTDIQNNKAIIKIKDNACGIPLDALSKIFEPYFTTKHQSQGTGLGLHMTYNLIVDGMRGTIEANNVEYKYDNKEYVGAEFVISLPII